MKEKKYRSNKKTIQNNNKIELSEILFPQGYEKLSIAFYMLIVPFLIGHIFLFTYVSKLNYSTYLAICTNDSALLIWCIGYEGFAILFFIFLFLNAMGNILQRQNKLK